MFVCKKCEGNLNLTENGRAWCWPESHGPCESCSKVDDCKDISTQYDWAWDDSINSDTDIKTWVQRNLNKKNGEA